MDCIFASGKFSDSIMPAQRSDFKKLMKTCVLLFRQQKCVFSRLRVFAKKKEIYESYVASNEKKQKIQ